MALWASRGGGDRCAPPGRGGTPSSSRVRVMFPAAALRQRRRRRQGIRSSRALPRLVGAPLRCRRRARGGGSPRVESLYMSLSVAARCPQGAMGAPAFYFEGTVVAAGFAADGWLDRARGSRGGGRHRRRGLIRDRGCLGCGPDHELLGDSLISFLGTSVYCGFCQSACAMVLPPIWAAVAGAGDPCWWGFLELSVHRGLGT